MIQAPSISITTTTFLTPADIARRVGRHPNTIKDMADQLHIEPARTANGGRLFTEEQAAKIAGEIQRREVEALRR